MTVLLGGPSPALLTAKMRYSSPLSRSWSDKVVSLSLAIPVLVHGPGGVRGVGFCRPRLFALFIVLGLISLDYSGLFFSCILDALELFNLYSGTRDFREVFPGGMGSERHQSLVEFSGEFGGCAGGRGRRTRFGRWRWIGRCGFGRLGAR